jgi:hypothetical protein
MRIRLLALVGALALTAGLTTGCCCDLFCEIPKCDPCAPKCNPCDTCSPCAAPCAPPVMVAPAPVPAK